MLFAGAADCEIIPLRGRARHGLSERSMKNRCAAGGIPALRKPNVSDAVTSVTALLTGTLHDERTPSSQSLRGMEGVVLSSTQETDNEHDD